MRTKPLEAGPAHAEGLADLEMLLESLPLTTEEHGCALNHLKNAQNYFGLGEVGAGLFEMRLLVGKLKRA